tara:strand:+ start:59 stop:481 length:423 start_codon:yes stop_codon:yes gene_type:complete
MDKDLPNPPKAVGNYTTIKRIGDFIYTSGHVPISDDVKYIGKIPKDQSTEKGYEAASLCAELTLATLSEFYDLKNLTPINIIGFVNCTDDFTEHPNVLNGFTDKLGEYFETKATRSAVGVSSLPMNVSVEVQTIFYINKE